MGKTAKIFLVGLTIALAIGKAFGQTTWNVAGGWNLLGNHSGGQLQVNSISSADLSKVNSIWAWDNGGSKWSVYVPSLSSGDLAAYAQARGYGVLTNIDPKQGFWVNANSTLTITSPWNSDNSGLHLYDIKSGWNLLGASTNKSPGQLLTDLKADLYSPESVPDAIWAWNTPTGKWQFYAPLLDQAQTLNDYANSHSYQTFTTVMPTGQGYWIHVPDTDLNNFYAVPTDLTKVVYPTSYTTTATSASDISHDPCNLDMSVVSYPKSWLGKHPLPTINGAPFAPDVGRAMSMKDIMTHDNPASIGPNAPNAPFGCKGDLWSEWNKTIARLKALNVEYVYLPQWHWGAIASDGSWYILSAENTSLTDADVGYFVNQAHKAGLKVLMYNQIQGMQDTTTMQTFMPASTMDNYKKWLGAYQQYIAERAIFFQSIGIDGWELGCYTCIYGDGGDNSPEASLLFEGEYKKAIATMKANFSGKVMLSVMANTWVPASDILNSVDILLTYVYVKQMTQAESDAVTIDSFITSARDFGWERVMKLFDSLGKTMLFTLDHAQARGNLLTDPGYVEETMCLPGVGDLSPNQTQCMEEYTSTDFSIQSIVFEASFEAIKALNLKSKVIIQTGDYWETDPLRPQTAFPNFSGSPRNKPAEGIIKAWFVK